MLQVAFRCGESFRSCTKEPGTHAATASALPLQAGRPALTFLGAAFLVVVVFFTCRPGQGSKRLSV